MICELQNLRVGRRRSLDKDAGRVGALNQMRPSGGLRIGRTGNRRGKFGRRADSAAAGLGYPAGWRRILQKSVYRGGYRGAEYPGMPGPVVVGGVEADHRRRLGGGRK